MWSLRTIRKNNFKISTMDFLESQTLIVTIRICALIVPESWLPVRPRSLTEALLACKVKVLRYPSHSNVLSFV